MMEIVVEHDGCAPDAIRVLDGMLEVVKGGHET
jgi:hypothetical protein